MNRTRPTRGTRCLLGALALGAAVPLGAQQRAGTIPQPHVALTHANVVDVTNGQVQRDVTVVLRDGRIVSVGTGPTPARAEVIDLGGRYVLPGLMDAHTHLDNLAAARRALESGVTTIRSATVGSYRDVTLRELVKAGWVAGPDVLAAGVFVRAELGDGVLADPKLGPLMASRVVTPEALRTLVRVNLDHGVDVIKTAATERAGLPNTDPRVQTYDETQLRAIVEEATSRNIPVEAHAHGDEGARAAVIAGVRSIEHGTYLSDSTLRLMKERGTYLVPTYSTLFDLVEPAGDYDDPVLKIRGAHMIPRMERTIRSAHAMGVKLVTGADNGYSPQSITRVSHEIVRFTQLGLPPLDAIRAATVTAAELFRIQDRTGRIAAGLEADVIVVEENPLENIVTVQDPLLVISNGRVGLNRLRRRPTS